ncbi:class C sortase [Ligilactobacillus faecis]|uniref:Class C sortase n=1 Tax=Ligilactobacillus faecis TaxID=762833 RepID=A0ABV4DMQ2_9LACO|nr:class C sortase [Ligilactobacillus faecis]WGN89567.1 class C sortase [Ligilactobacillus faecis]
MKRISHILYYAFWTLLCLSIIGVSTYPFISDFMLAQKQKSQIEHFDKQDKKTSKKDYLEAFYKKRSTKKQVSDPFTREEKQKDSGNSVDVAKSQLTTIAVLSIPKLKEVLPVYDNTSSIALDNGVGLLENTSDPTGGKGKHAVLTGHSGLSLNKLFTDLSKVKLGDKFYLKVNGEIHAYKIDQIKKVLPDNMKYLQVEKDKDLITLVTCTPIFINTHRLLVRGHRVAYDRTVEIQTDGGLTSLGKGILVGIGSMLIIVVIVYLMKKHTAHKKQLIQNERTGLRKV